MAAVRSVPIFMGCPAMVAGKNRSKRYAGPLNPGFTMVGAGVSPSARAAVHCRKDLERPAIARAGKIAGKRLAEDRFIRYGFEQRHRRAELGVVGRPEDRVDA